MELGTMLAATAPSAIGGFFGLFGQRKREERYNKQQLGLMDLQQQNQMALNRQGHELQLKAWNETGYKQQMKQMAEAGLNPALMYGMSGGGGQTTGTQTGGQAGHGSPAPPQFMDIQSLMNFGNIVADTALKAALTKKAGAEIPKLESETKLTEAQTLSVKSTIEMIEENIQSEQIKRVGYSLDNDFKRLENYVMNETADFSIDRAKWLSEQASLETDKIIQLIEGEKLDNELKDKILEKVCCLS